MPNIRNDGSSDAVEMERNGFNSAFSELGLDWHWDARIYADLQAIPEATDRVRTYVTQHRPHLLRAYDADFLANAIEALRTRSGKGSAY